MRYIEYAIYAFQVLIFFGGSIRVGVIILQKSQDDSSNGAIHNKRIRNTITFMIAGLSAFVILDIILWYLS